MPLNNHIYVAGQEGYQDNSAVVAYDPEEAKRELDALGWQLNGQFREKDGRQLVIRDVFYDAQSTRQVAQIAQNSLAQIGVKLELDAKGGSGFFTNYIIAGRLRHRPVRLGGRRFPAAPPHPDLRCPAGRATSARSAARRSTRKIEQTLRRTRPGQGPRPGQRTRQDDLGEGFSLPLFQSAGQRRGAQHLANFGPAGLGDLNYTAIGFMK